MGKNGIENMPADVREAGKIISDTINETAKRAKKLKRDELEFLFASLTTHYALFAPASYKDWMETILLAASKGK